MKQEEIQKRVGESVEALMGQFFNWAQSVLGSWQELLDLKDDLVLKAATGFGGGVGGRGSLCGVISGSVMAIGLKYGRGREDEMSAAMDTYLRCSQLLDWFKNEFGSEMCYDLTGGIDFRDPEQLSQYYATGHKKCVEMAARTAAKIAELLE